MEPLFTPAEGIAIKMAKEGFPLNEPPFHWCYNASGAGKGFPRAEAGVQSQGYHFPKLSNFSPQPNAKATPRGAVFNRSAASF